MIAPQGLSRSTYIQSTYYLNIFRSGSKRGKCTANAKRNAIEIARILSRANFRMMVLADRRVSQLFRPHGKFARNVARTRRARISRTLHD
jgi:hypothetical protein